MKMIGTPICGYRLDADDSYPHLWMMMIICGCKLDEDDDSMSIMIGS